MRASQPGRPTNVTVVTIGSTRILVLGCQGERVASTALSHRSVAPFGRTVQPHIGT